MHAAFGILDAVLPFWNCNHPAVGSLETVAARRDSAHAAVRPLKAVTATFYRDHAAIGALETVAACWNRAHATIAPLKSVTTLRDRDHVAIGALKAVAAVGNCHGLPIPTGQFVRHRTILFSRPTMGPQPSIAKAGFH